jgi:predicted PurR-regulated permease PerM
VDLEPLSGPTYEIKVASATPGASYDILIALLVVNILLLGAFAVFTAIQVGRAGGHPAFARILWRKILTLSVLGGLAVYFLWAVRAILTPFLIAFFLASLLDPVVSNLQKSGRSRAATVGGIFGLVFLSIALSVILLVRFAVPEMTELASNVPKYIQTVTTRSDGLYKQYEKPLSAIGVKANPLRDRTGPLSTTALSVLDTVRGQLTGFIGEALWFIIIPLSLFFFLLEYQHLRTKLISFVPEKYQANVDRMSQEVVDIFSQYIRGLAKVCVMYGFAAMLIFGLLFHLHYFVFLGIGAGVLYAVPYVGPAVAMATVGVVAFTTTGSPGLAVFVVAVFAAMHVTFDYVLTPRIVGGSVGLHPLVNVFALMCGASLFGVWGMLLAVPVAASIQMILFYFFPKLTEEPVIHSPYTKMDGDPVAELEGEAAPEPAGAGRR